MRYIISVCDITFASPGCKFAFSEVKLGIIPSVISTFISKRVKVSDMRRLFITGERFDTEAAYKIGLIDFIIENEELDSKIDHYKDQIISSGPNAIFEIKKLINNYHNLKESDYKKHTVEKISELRISKEGQEGINTFLEKKKPSWSK